MANQNGKKYGFTGLFPIGKGDHAAALRAHLRKLDGKPYGSPLSEVRAIHMARFAVIDGLAYQGLPAKRDSLSSSYLLFLCDFDGESPDALVADLIAADPAKRWRRSGGTAWSFPASDPWTPSPPISDDARSTRTCFWRTGPTTPSTIFSGHLLYKRKFGDFHALDPESERPVRPA